MFASAHQVRSRWRELLRGRPGYRFQGWYERAKASRYRVGPLRRIGLVLIALLCLAIGIVLVIFPGPAIPFLMMAGGLLGLESRRIARLMDWLEVRFRGLFRWALGHWRRAPSVARVLVVMTAGGVSATFAYVAYRFVLRG